LVEAARSCGSEDTVTHFFDLKWLLLIPTLPTVGVMVWRVLRLTRDRSGRLQRFSGLFRRNRVEVWD
jgi:hypothetical protein